MKTASIGYFREDGDFAIVATLNNNDGLLDDEAFAYVLTKLAGRLKHESEQPMSILERQDTPDYVNVEV